MFFVERYESFHGVGRLTYNIHNLIHLANDVKNYGSLDNFSCFPFENYLRRLKQKIKAAEENNCSLQKPNPKMYPLLCRSKSTKVELEGFTLSERSPNNCVQTFSSAIIIISKLYEANGEIFLDGKQIIEKGPFFDDPYDSQKLNIYLCKTSTAIKVKKSFCIERL